MIEVKNLRKILMRILNIKGCQKQKHDDDQSTAADLEETKKTDNTLQPHS